jgi:PAS domain S-box-containing protein
MANRGSPRDPNGDIQRALETSDARYAALVDRAGYGIYRSSLDGRFDDVNSVLVTMLGYASAEELLRVDIARDVYLDPGERDRLRSRPTALAFSGWVETRWKRRDGSPIHVRLSVRPLLDGKGNVESYDGIVEDITEHQRQDELLRRSERMASLGTTLAGVAHELNNPLAAILGFAQLLLKKPWPAEDRAALETINHEAIRSATIVKDLLTLARKRDVERRVRTDMNDVVGYIARTRRYALKTAGIACTLDLQPRLPAVFGDRTQLEQVVLNLLNNAEQALHVRSDAPNRGPGAAGHIRIRTWQEDRRVVIELEDDGPGIPEDVQSKIWDPFWTTKDEGEGTGLGLAVVHSIVTDHGGTISVDNAPGSGARFVIHLPVAEEGEVPMDAGHAIRPLDVLIVEPGATDLLFIERFLTSRGHAVISAGTGELALRLANQTSFDAVVCDARLIGTGGLPVATALRLSTGCARARFVLSVPPDDFAVPIAMEDASIVSRPYDVEDIRRLIEGD